MSAGSAQPVCAVTDVDTGGRAELAPAAPPSFRGGWCLYWQELRAEAGGEAVGGWLGERGPGGPGPGRRRAGVRRTRRPVPARAASALLPAARLGAGRRGRAAGDLAGGLAGPGRVRGPLLGPVLAVPDRHSALPQRAALGSPAAADGLATAGGGAARADPAR